MLEHNKVSIIRSKAYPTKVANIYGSDAMDNAAITLWDETGHPTQQFVVRPNQGFGKIHSALNDKKALNVSRWAKNRGQATILTEAGNDLDSIIETRANGDGSYRVEIVGGPCKGDVLTATGGNNGDKLIWTTPNGSDNQKWIFEAVEAGGNGSSGGSVDIQSVNQMSYTNIGYTFAINACLASCLLAVARWKGNNIQMQDLINKGCVRKSDAWVNTPQPYIAWTFGNKYVNEAAYSKAITDQINDGKPAVICLYRGAGEHYVVAVSGGSNADQIRVMDPADGVFRSLRGVYSRGYRYRSLGVIE